jgi:hypothetical protein
MSIYARIDRHGEFGELVRSARGMSGRDAAMPSAADIPGF